MSELTDSTAAERTTGLGGSESRVAAQAPRARQGTSAGPRAQAPSREIALIIDPSRARRFHRELAARLARDAGVRVTFIRGRATPTPPSIELLFDLERLAYRLHGPRSSDRLEFGALKLSEFSPDPPDLVIDLCGHKEPASGRVVRVLCDG